MVDFFFFMASMIMVGHFELAIVKKTSLRTRIAFVGTGNLGRVMALAFHEAGYPITELISREGAPSQRRARALAKKLGARAATLEPANLDCDVIWLTVPDHAIAECAARLSRSAEWKGKVALHCSGALPASVLAPLQRAGAAIASAHPMNSFVTGSRADFSDVPFALEGEPRAVAIAKQLVSRIGGK